MALGDLKGSDSVYLLIAAAMFGAVVKTTVDRGSQNMEGSARDKGSSEKHAAKAHEAAPDEAPPGPSEPSPPPSSDVSQVLRAELGDPAGGHCAIEQFGVVIALVPDPATSGFVEGFDAGLDAIQQAAQSLRFTVYRHWLPWERDGKAMAGRADVSRAGWLLFRRDVASREAGNTWTSSRVLLVLVVGERLGSGVNAAMLADALSLHAKLAGQAPLRILGPYFSGTAASLRAGLEKWCERPGAGGCAQETAEIISGTATRALNDRVLRGTRGLPVSFHATVNPDGRLTEGMHRFLEDSLDVRPSRIAELTETSTAFGVEHAHAADRRTGRSDPPTLRISYPAHLPDLRAGAAGAEPVFRDGDDSVDQVPLFTLDTLRHAKLMLAGTIEALRRQGVTDAGILATGADDKISLVTALRGAASDIRPHLYEANLALADPAQHAVMDGTLVASSYPLSAATQIWSGRTSVQQFGSDAAEGIYNALLALLASGDGAGRLLDPRDLEDALLDYGFPFGKNDTVGPPVWISVIVGGQIWPLAAYATHDPEATGYVFPARSPARRLHIDRGRFATVVLLLLLIVVGGNLLSLVRAFRPLRRRCPFLLLYDPAEPPATHPSANDGFLCLERLASPEARAPRFLAIWVSSIVGSAAAALFEIPRFVRQQVDLALGDGIAVLLLLASLLLFLAPMGAGPSPEPAVPVPGPRGALQRWWVKFRWASHAVAMTASLIVVGLRLRAFTHLPDDKMDGRALLFFARVVHPEVGLAPALPLMLMAVAIYVSCLFRLRAVRRGNVLQAAGPQWAASGVPGVSDDVARFTQNSLRSLNGVFAVGALVGVALFKWLRAGSLEGPTFDFLVAIGFGVTFSIAVASIWRANQLWLTMAKLLRSLAVHPWAPAFGKLPEHLSQAFRTPMPGRLSHEEVSRDRAVVAWVADANPMDEAQPGPPQGSRVDAYLKELQPVWTSPQAQLPALGTKEAERPGAVQLREHYLAICMAESLSQMCDIMRTALFVGATAAVAAVLAMTVYPFQSAGTLAWAAPITIVVVVLVALRVSVGIERDEILSRMAGTEPGKLTLSWALVARFLGYVVVPLASLAAATLPDHGVIARMLGSLNGSIQP